MKKVTAALAVVFCALWLAAVPVGAQYVTPPGHGPQVGGSDTGARYTGHSTSSTRHSSGGSTGGGVEVLGVRFIRGANGEAIALTGAGISTLVLLGFGLVSMGVVLKRRSRHLGGAATA